MTIQIFPDKDQIGREAARQGADAIRAALNENGKATIIVATGMSQFEMLSYLVQEPDIDWSRVTGFHLDEYVGLPDTHPASFRRYLRERLVEMLPAPLAAFHYIDGEATPQAECARVGALLRAAEPVCVAFIGIGENGHIAFNDPPADFETEEPYLVVMLDDACRQQQLGEGWFPTFESVPTQAISMSVWQILKANLLVCTVPDARKAVAVKGCVEGEVTPHVPASILQTHPNTLLYLDAASAALLK
jgi:glucosamine-6-phosphate deaminase